VAPVGAAGAQVRVSDLVDGQKISPFLLKIMVLGFLAQLGDGYDLAAAAYSAPNLAHAWQVKRELLAPVFSAGLFGMLFGAPLFGLVGDRHGRRIAIVISAAVCGVFSLGSAFTHTITELALMRFCTGVGLGGLAANTIALMAEYAPSKTRATLITLMFMGITFGGMCPALVTVLAPHSGWRTLFLVGGVAPLAACLLNLLFLPESLKFLAARDAERGPVLDLARAMRRDLVLGDDVELLFPHAPSHRFRIGELFEGRLKWITPLLWVIFITNLLCNFFLNSWMPTVLRESGLSNTEAAVTTSMYYVGGVFGGLTISRFLDRGGLAVVGAFMLLACPAVALMGLPGYSPAMLKFVVFLVGLTVLGNQLGLNAVAGLCYPTIIRANGAGWALGIGRFGAILGPLVGGQLLAMHLQLRLLFLAPVLPLAVGAAAAFALIPFARDRFGGAKDPPGSGLEPSPELPGGAVLRAS
jgi:MFS transporter, AAHS family, 4-hydroxybenzoate transporter